MSYQNNSNSLNKHPTAVIAKTKPLNIIAKYASNHEVETKVTKFTSKLKDKLSYFGI
jgi:hypothetical protein